MGSFRIYVLEMLYIFRFDMYQYKADDYFIDSLPNNIEIIFYSWNISQDSILKTSENTLEQWYQVTLVGLLVPNSG